MCFYVQSQVSTCSSCVWIFFIFNGAVLCVTFGPADMIGQEEAMQYSSRVLYSTEIAL